MSRSGEVSLSLSGSQVSAVKRPSSSSGSRPNSSGGVRGTRPASSGGNRPNSNRGVSSGSKITGRDPSSARSVTFSSNPGTPRSSRKSTGEKLSVRGKYAAPSNERRNLAVNGEGPQGDMVC